MIKPSFCSDHSKIVLKLKCVSFDHGKGLWKHNNSLLKNLDYLKEINKIIDKTIIEYAVPIYNYENILDINPSDLQLTINDQLFLDILFIRGKSISYSSYKKKESNKQEIVIKEQIENLENSFSADKVEQLNNLKEELNKIQNEKLKGFMIRLIVDWIIDGEKPSKLFCNLEKNNYITKTIFRVINDDGTEI
jgi:hypothetical protein